MNNIPTAEEWLKHFEENAYPDTPISECMIEFAKLHVKAQQEAILEKVSMVKDCGRKDDIGCDAVFCRNCLETIDKESILNAYPLTNIK
jgi:hypothetical protein